MRHDDPTPPSTEALERLLRRALPVLALLALVALAATLVRPSADLDRPVAAADPAADPLKAMAPAPDDTPAAPDDAALVGASIAAYWP